MSETPMRRIAGAGECAVSRMWSMECSTASAAWAAETSCAPLHSMGLRMVAIVLLPRVAGTPWPGGSISEPSVTANPWTCASGETIPLRQVVAEADISSRRCENGGGDSVLGGLQGGCILCPPARDVAQSLTRSVYCARIEVILSGQKRLDAVRAGQGLVAAPHRVAHFNLLFKSLQLPDHGRGTGHASGATL